MKKSFVKKFYFLIIASFLLLSSSCLNEDAIEKVASEHKHRFDKEIVSFSKVNYLQPQINNFYQARNSNQKSLTPDSLDLDLSRVLILEDSQSNYKSYSIVINSNNSNNYFENLHIIEKDDIQTDSFIFKWTPDSLETFNANTFSGKLEKYDLNYQLLASNTFTNGNSNLNEAKMVCVLLSICSCSGTPYYCGCSICPMLYTNHCSFVSGGGGDASGDTSGGDGDGFGGGGTNTDEDNSDFQAHGNPVIPLEPLPVPTVPCNELKKLTQQPAVNSPTIPTPHKTTRDAIIQMSNEVTPNAEAGYEFLNIPAGNYAKHIPPASNDPNHVYFPKNNSYCYGGIHTHPSDISQWTQMFSHDDLYFLVEKQNTYTGPNTSGNDLFTLIMTAQIGNNNYTYAIKITDINKLTNSLQNWHSNDVLWEKYGRKLFSYYSDSSGYPLTSITYYEKAFLQFVQDEDLGVSLYEMKQNANGDPTWNKLELNGNNTPNRIPCN